MKKPITIFAQYFHVNYEHDYIEYQISEVRNHFELRERTHFDNMQREAVGEWGLVTRHLSLEDVFEGILIVLRSKEISNGLYKLVAKAYPTNLYKNIVYTWVDYVLRLDNFTFHVYGNRIKYRKAEPPETTKKYLEFYKGLLQSGEWHTSSSADIILEEFFKREISTVNDQKYSTSPFKDLILE